MLERGVIEMVDTESLVPAGHLLRQMDAAVDFEKLYEIVPEEGQGHPPGLTRDGTVQHLLAGLPRQSHLGSLPGDPGPSHFAVRGKGAGGTGVCLRLEEEANGCSRPVCRSR